MLAAFIALGYQMSHAVPPSPDVAHAIPAPPLQQRWLASGFDRVTPTVLGRDDTFADAGSVHEGSVNVSVDVAALVAEGWRGFRIEAWRALRTGVDEPFTLDPSATGPNAIVVVPDPLDEPNATIDVSGTPGLDRFLLFATAIDPASGQRVTIDWPTDGDTTFYGTVVDWFVALASGGASLDR